jgi:hypothetical protein
VSVRQSWLGTCSTWGDKARDGGPGFGLVTLRQDPLNLRRQCILTDKGRVVAGAIVRAMDGGF